MSLIVVKRLMYGVMPSFRDSTVLMLLALHFITFLAFHSRLGKNVMDKLRSN